MAWDDLDLGDNTGFPSLWVALSWIEAHCIVPDGFKRGDWFELVPWQAVAFLNHYRVKPSARVGQLSTAFHYQLSQVVLPQKAGKAPWSSAQICLEGVGPSLFAGWAKGGEVYDCRDHGCGCGWVYEYGPGEAMGMRRPTPLIQITATAEDQTANIYSALRPMIDDGPLSALIPYTGESFIRLPDNGRIDPVTSNGRSRLGQRVTFIPWDESGLYTKSNKMFGFPEAVYDTQRRGLGGMQGRGVDTTNAWDPNQDSAAKQVAEDAKVHSDIYRMHPMAPEGLKYTVRAERRKIHGFVYDGCPWIDLDAIEGEAAKLVTRDPGQAERFYGNRPTAGAGVAFDMDALKALRVKEPRTVPAGAAIVIGVDGAHHDDALAIVACEIKTGYIWPLAIIERPENAPDDYKHDQSIADGAVRDAMERYVVWRLYADPQYISDLIDGWANSYGRKRVIEWFTNRDRQMAWAVRNYTEAIGRGEVSHDGNEVFLRHHANARKRVTTVLDDNERPMYVLSKEHPHSELKKDTADASVVVWEARGDAIKAGVHLGADPALEAEKKPAAWSPGHAPDMSAYLPAGEVAPMGSMS